MDKIIQTLKRNRMIRNTCLCEAQCTHYRGLFGISDDFYAALTHGQRNIVVTAMLLILFLKVEFPLRESYPPELLNCARDVAQMLRGASEEETMTRTEIIGRIRDDLREMAPHLS